VELLVAVAILCILVSIAVPAATSSLSRTKNAQCLGKLKVLGTAIVLFSQDNEGEFPKTRHSGHEAWSQYLLPYLGLSTNPTSAEWNARFRCPVDKQSNTNIWSYAWNVYFELSSYEDYEGAPATWHKTVNVDRPGATILLAESKGSFNADHLMCHLWTGLKGASNAVDTKRNGKTSNYLFVDGHAESLPVESTFNPAKNINKWNPSTAR